MSPTVIEITFQDIQAGIRALAALQGINVKGHSTDVGLTLHNLRQAAQAISKVLEDVKESFLLTHNGEKVPMCDVPLDLARYRGRYDSGASYLAGDIVLEDGIYYEASDPKGISPKVDRSGWSLYGNAQPRFYIRDIIGLQEAINEVNTARFPVEVYLIPKGAVMELDKKNPAFTPEMVWPLHWKETWEADAVKEIASRVSSIMDRLNIPAN